MDFPQIKNLLIASGRFDDLDRYDISPVAGGTVSSNVYRLRRDGGDYLVKEVQPNERNTMQLLHRLGLAICQEIVCPELLEQFVLVTPFIAGEPARGKSLEPELVADYAAMQNALNTRALFDSGNVPPRCKFTAADEGGFARGLIARGCTQGLKNLQAVQLPVAKRYLAMADRIARDQERIADAHGSMPFGWLHHDFREANILGTPQTLVDWGSSWGHGPFLFDLAPFLALDDAAMRAFAAHSDICRQETQAEIDHWLRAALCAVFCGFLLWRLPSPEAAARGADQDAALAAMLEYEFAPFERLAAMLS